MMMQEQRSVKPSAQPTLVRTQHLPGPSLQGGGHQGPVDRPGAGRPGPVHGRRIHDRAVRGYPGILGLVQQLPVRGADHAG